MADLKDTIVDGALQSDSLTVGQPPETKTYTAYANVEKGEFVAGITSNIAKPIDTTICCVPDVTYQQCEWACQAKFDSIEDAYELVSFQRWLGLEEDDVCFCNCGGNTCCGEYSCEIFACKSLLCCGDVEGVFRCGYLCNCIKPVFGVETTCPLPCPVGVTGWCEGYEQKVFSCKGHDMATFSLNPYNIAPGFSRCSACRMMTVRQSMGLHPTQSVKIMEPFDYDCYRDKVIMAFTVGYQCARAVGDNAPFCSRYGFCSAFCCDYNSDPNCYVHNIDDCVPCWYCKLKTAARIWTGTVNAAAFTTDRTLPQYKFHCDHLSCCCCWTPRCPGLVDTFSTSLCVYDCCCVGVFEDDTCYRDGVACRIYMPDYEYCSDNRECYGMFSCAQTEAYRSRSESAVGFGVSHFGLWRVGQDGVYVGLNFGFQCGGCGGASANTHRDALLSFVGKLESNGAFHFYNPCDEERERVAAHQYVSAHYGQCSLNDTVGKYSICQSDTYDLNTYIFRGPFMSYGYDTPCHDDTLCQTMAFFVESGNCLVMKRYKIPQLNASGCFVSSAEGYTHNTSPYSCCAVCVEDFCLCCDENACCEAIHGFGSRDQLNMPFLWNYKTGQGILRGCRHEYSEFGSHAIHFNTNDGNMVSHCVEEPCCFMCAEFRREDSGWDYQIHATDCNHDRYIKMIRDCQCCLNQFNDACPELRCCYSSDGCDNYVIMSMPIYNPPFSCGNVTCQCNQFYVCRYFQKYTNVCTWEELECTDDLGCVCSTICRCHYFDGLTVFCAPNVNGCCYQLCMPSSCYNTACDNGCCTGCNYLCTNYWRGQWMIVTGGTGAGQVRQICCNCRGLGNCPMCLKVFTPFDPVLDNTSCIDLCRCYVPLCDLERPCMLLFCSERNAYACTMRNTCKNYVKLEPVGNSSTSTYNLYVYPYKDVFTCAGRDFSKVYFLCFDLEANGAFTNICECCLCVIPFESCHRTDGLDSRGALHQCANRQCHIDYYLDEARPAKCNEEIDQRFFDSSDIQGTGNHPCGNFPIVCTYLPGEGLGCYFLGINGKGINRASRQSANCKHTGSVCFRCDGNQMQNVDDGFEVENYYYNCFNRHDMACIDDAGGGGEFRGGQQMGQYMGFWHYSCDFANTGCPISIVGRQGDVGRYCGRCRGISCNQQMIYPLLKRTHFQKATTNTYRNCHKSKLGVYSTRDYIEHGFAPQVYPMGVANITSPGYSFTCVTEQCEIVGIAESSAQEGETFTVRPNGSITSNTFTGLTPGRQYFYQTYGTTDANLRACFVTADQLQCGPGDEYVRVGCAITANTFSLNLAFETANAASIFADREVNKCIPGVPIEQFKTLECCAMRMYDAGCDDCIGKLCLHQLKVTAARTGEYFGEIKTCVRNNDHSKTNYYNCYYCCPQQGVCLMGVHDEHCSRISRSGNDFAFWKVTVPGDRMYRLSAVCVEAENDLTPINFCSGINQARLPFGLVRYDLAIGRSYWLDELTCCKPTFLQHLSCFGNYPARPCGICQRCKLWPYNEHCCDCFACMHEGTCDWMNDSGIVPKSLRDNPCRNRVSNNLCRQSLADQDNCRHHERPCIEGYHHSCVLYDAEWSCYFQRCGWPSNHRRVLVYTSNAGKRNRFEPCFHFGECRDCSCDYFCYVACCSRHWCCLFNCFYDTHTNQMSESEKVYDGLENNNPCCCDFGAQACLGCQISNGDLPIDFNQWIPSFYGKSDYPYVCCGINPHQECHDVQVPFYENPNMDYMLCWCGEKACCEFAYGLPNVLYPGRTYYVGVNYHVCFGKEQMRRGTNGARFGAKVIFDVFCCEDFC